MFFFFFFYKGCTKKAGSWSTAAVKRTFNKVFFFSEVEVSWQNAEKKPCSASEGKHLKQISENVKI